MLIAVIVLSFSNQSRKLFFFEATLKRFRLHLHPIASVCNQHAKTDFGKVKESY